MRGNGRARGGPGRTRRARRGRPRRRSGTSGCDLAEPGSAQAAQGILGGPAARSIRTIGNCCARDRRPGNGRGPSARSAPHPTPAEGRFDRSRTEPSNPESSAGCSGCRRADEPRGGQGLHQPETREGGRRGKRRRSLGRASIPDGPGRASARRTLCSLLHWSAERPSTSSGMIFRAWSRTKAVAAASESREIALRAIRSQS